MENGHLKANPAKPVKELRRQQLAPKGMERDEVRRLLREVELREDVRAGAIFSLFLYTGCRVSDLVALELHDLMLVRTERHGGVPLGQGQQTAVSAVAASGPACIAGLSWNPARLCKPAGSSSANGGR